MEVFPQPGRPQRNMPRQDPAALALPMLSRMSALLGKNVFSKVRGLLNSDTPVSKSLTVRSIWHGNRAASWATMSSSHLVSPWMLMVGEESLISKAMWKRPKRSASGSLDSLMPQLTVAVMSVPMTGSAWRVSGGVRRPWSVRRMQSASSLFMTETTLWGALFPASPVRWISRVLHRGACGSGSGCGSGYGSGLPSCLGRRRSLAPVTQRRRKRATSLSSNWERMRLSIMLRWGSKRTKVPLTYSLKIFTSSVATRLLIPARGC
mmetsp:Transcript_34987/g.82969  ORF Transcript_34987/g.82969 Transcript_34987/m.82969 type:complete len:264 (+) Transcript_34987:896-1687(+)